MPFSGEQKLVLVLELLQAARCNEIFDSDELVFVTPSHRDG
jgi:hypothetical protein